MKKLTRYTSIGDLKASSTQLPLPSQQADSKYTSALIEFIAVMKQHSFTLKQSKSGKSPNKSTSGK